MFSFIGNLALQKLETRVLSGLLCGQCKQRKRRESVQMAALTEDVLWTHAEIAV